MRNCMISWQHLFYRYFQIFILFQQIMITHWDILWNLGFTIWGLIEARFWTVNWLLVADLVSFLMFWFCLSFFSFFFFTHANRITAHLFPCSNKRRKWFIHSNTRGSYSSLRCLLSCAPTNASRNPNLGASLPVNSLNS